MTPTLPTLTFDTLQHIGTLDPNHIGQRGAGGGVSFEGHHFSVSVHPSDWRRIAQLGDDTPEWTLTRHGSRFLDANALWDDLDHVIHLRQWGQDRQLITLEPTYVTRTAGHDSANWATLTEAVQGLTSLVTPDVAATLNTLLTTGSATLTSVNAADPDTSVPLVTPAYHWRATPDLQQITGLPASMGEIALLIAYAEHHQLDGVWWTDTLTWWWAPRGLILRSRLSQWTATPLP